MNVNAYVHFSHKEVTEEERKAALEIDGEAGVAVEGDLSDPEMYIEDGKFHASGLVGSAWVSFSFEVRDFMNKYFDDISHVIVEEIKTKLKFFESVKGLLK